MSAPITDPPLPGRMIAAPLWSAPAMPALRQRWHGRRTSDVLLTRSYLCHTLCSTLSMEDSVMTTIPRWTVASPDFKNLQTQLNCIFEPFARMSADEDLATGTWVPPVDVAETQETILVRAEVPGMKQEEIAIEFENGTLTITGERKPEESGAEGRGMKGERTTIECGHGPLPIKGERKLEKKGDGMRWHRVMRSPFFSS